MKTLIAAALAATVLAAPALSFAQQSQPLSRAQVRAELVQAEKAGLNPSVDTLTYPQGVQEAQARVAQQPGAEQAYGGVANGSAQSGARVLVPTQPVYVGQ